MTGWQRLGYWLLSMSVNSALYFTTGILAGHAEVLPELALDRWIGTTPWALLPYLSFFLLIPLTFLYAPDRSIVPLAAGIVLSAATAAVVFCVYPTTVAYSEAIGYGLLGQAIQWLRMIDTPKNCLPSLHGAISALCVVAWIPAPSKVKKGMLLCWAISICWSAIALRQHLTVDILAGVALGTTYAALLHIPHRLNPTKTGRYTDQRMVGSAECPHSEA